jgi:hypothetical protein
MDVAVPIVNRKSYIVAGNLSLGSVHVEVGPRIGPDGLRRDIGLNNTFSWPRIWHLLGGFGDFCRNGVIVALLVCVLPLLLDASALNDTLLDMTRHDMGTWEAICLIVIVCSGYSSHRFPRQL